MKLNFNLRWKFITNNKSALYIHLPINNGNQKILSLELSKNPKKLFKEKYYSYAKYITKKNIDIEAKVEANIRRIDKYKDSNDVRFLVKEPKLLTSKTKKFVKGLSNVREIYDWIIENIGRPKVLKHYLKDLTKDDSDDLKMAVYKKKAMCGGKSLLFVSMCRNLGIPARIVSGYFMRDGWSWLKNSKLHSNWFDMHVWAEFYQRGWWVPVDVNIAQQTRNDYFGKFPKYTFKNKDIRLAVSKGSRFMIDKKVRYLLQTAHFDKGRNLRISLVIK